MTNRKPYQQKNTVQSETVFGQRLKLERMRREFKITRFSELSGVDPTQITSYENRNIMPSVKNLIRMAQALDCSTDWLLGLED
jgi:transcriptional regulator with XRE-family HTH domain